MKTGQTMYRLAHFTAAAAIVAAITTSASLAQRTERKVAALESGLAALSDDAVYNELAARKMDVLLDYAFDANKVPEMQRQAALAIPAIKRLSDEENPPRPHERVQLIKRISAGADRIVAAEDSAQRLMEHAAALIKHGVEPEVNLMEYWGETPQVQKRLAPVANAVVKMLDKAVELSADERKKAEDALNRGRGDKAIDKWVEANQLATTAEFTRAMIAYNQAMSVPATDAKGLESRKKIADKALEDLARFDSPDEGVQAAARNRMAKLHMVKREFGPANDLFESVIAGKVDDKTKIDPPPAPVEQYEARYFSVVCEMMQGDIERASKGLEDLIRWQREAVKDPKAQEGLDAAAEMLRYRIALKERDKASDPAAKKAAEERALAILMKLYNDRKDLRGIIAEQLVDALGEDVDVKTQKTLILQAMISKGHQAREGFDAKNPERELVTQMEQGIAAAREVLERRAKGSDPEITTDTVSTAAAAIPLFLQAMNKRVEAANGYIDYIEKKHGDPGRQLGAFNEAGGLLVKLRADPATKADPEVEKAWDRFLPIAIDTFKRKEFAYEYAIRLRNRKPPNYAEAVKYFRQVPTDDARRLTLARYREMLALTDWIYARGEGDKPLLNPQQQSQRVQEALKVADDVRRLSIEALKRAKDKAEQAALRSRIAVVTTIQAQLAAYGTKPDWAKVISVLEGFEQQSKGLSSEASLNKTAMELRVNAYMQLKQFDKAADVLIKLLEKEPGGRAAGLVLGILQRLNENYERAVAEGKTDEARDILSDRAKLSGRLVTWASTNTDPNVKKNLYVYKVYDADTQRLYGTALEGAERTTQLQKAMEAFRTMRSPENLAAYEAMVAERKKENSRDKTDPKYPDPAVTLGMALTSYDLKDWKTAAVELKRLSFHGKLGTRNSIDVDERTGETKEVPNEQYWEAMAKYYDAVRRWATDDAGNKDAQAELGAVKTLIKRDYVSDPDGVGGNKWRDEFESLRKELIPDLNLDELRKSQPAAPATQRGEPVAQGAARR